MMINESKIKEEILNCLNESSSEENVVSKEPEENKNPGNGEWTFADWFGEDLTGKTYKGSIDCSYADLTSLEGAPKEVGGSFFCMFNKLTSLEGAPETVGGHFCCVSNRLTSLEGAPSKVGKDFECSSNKLTSLKGGPKEVGGSFYCMLNKLTSLEGAPEKVGEDFICSDNNLPEDEFPDTEISGDLVIDHAVHLYRNQADTKYDREKLKTTRFSKTPNRVIDKSTLKGMMRNVEEIFVTMEEAGFLESDPEMSAAQQLLNALNKLL